MLKYTPHLLALGKGQRITSNELEQMRNVFEIQWENIRLAEA
jgi:hypothetical protein